MRVEFYARLSPVPLGTPGFDHDAEEAGSIEGVAILGGEELAMLERAYRDQTPLVSPWGDDDDEEHETAVYVTELGYAPEPEP